MKNGISFVHIRDPNNSGDLASCAAAYFDFGPHVEVINYTQTPTHGIVVFGGGTMVNWLNGRRGLPDVPKVIWGAGSSRHGETEPWPDPEGFSLIGTREWSPAREKAGLYAPCPSCMSPLFDREYEITRERVAFVNASESIRARYPAIYNLPLPTIDNSWPMEAIVEFLAKAETVVTNSYHGLAWTRWLGRNVEVHGYSSKFHRLAPHTLEEARDITRRFYERVMALVGERVAA